MWAPRMGRGMVSDPPKKFHLDRPSIFVLLDPESGRLPDPGGQFFALGALGRVLRLFLWYFEAFWGVFGGLSCGYPRETHGNVSRGYWEGSGRVLGASGRRSVVFLGPWACIWAQGAR